MPVLRLKKLRTIFLIFRDEESELGFTGKCTKSDKSELRDHELNETRRTKKGRLASKDKPYCLLLN